LLALIAVTASGCTSTKSRPLGWSGVTVSGNELYFGTHTGKLISLNKDSGTVRWQTDLANAQGIYGSPLVVNDTVYVTSYGGRVFAVTTAGVLKWTSPTPEDVKLPDAIISGLAFSSGRLYYGSNDGKVYALDAATGAQVWTFATGDKIWATPVIDNGVVYVGSFDNKLYALSAVDGRELWHFEASGVFIAAPVIAVDTVFVGSLDRNLYSLDKNTGAKKWQFTGEKWFWASPLLVGSNLYAANTDGKVYVVDSASGGKVTEFSLAAPVAAGLAAVNGQVIVAAETGGVYVIDTPTQQMRDLIDLDTTVRAPLSASGEVVFIHSQANETVYALNAVTRTQLWLYKVQ
jgi:outer membrane protein assembly factor BamB